MRSTRRSRTVSGMPDDILPSPAPVKRAIPRRNTRLSAADHHVQNALEKFAVARLQDLAEQRGVAGDGASASELYADYHASLAEHGHSHETVGQNKRHATYLRNIEAGAADFVARLTDTRPKHSLVFRFIGREGRLEQRKGDIELTSTSGGTTKVESISLKNYEKGVQRIQVCSGTFQSFALSFVLTPAGIGKWQSPAGGPARSTSSKLFKDWRNTTLRETGHGDLVEDLQAIDELNTQMRDRFLSDEFVYFDEEKVAAERARVGNEGARHLERLLSKVAPESIRDRILKMTGLDGSEDLLMVGGGMIADTITDQKFGALVRRVRTAALKVRQHGQGLRFDFVQPNGEQVLGVQVPCTINTNGAWYRDGEAYEGVRPHPKEKVDLAWGQRRPKKSREIATSINTYIDLAAAGVLRALPRPNAEVAA